MTGTQGGKTWVEWSREVAELMMKDAGMDPGDYEGPDEALRGFFEDGDSPKGVLEYYEKKSNQVLIDG